jgi:hypothetical protein
MTIAGRGAEADAVEGGGGSGWYVLPLTAAYVASPGAEEEEEAGARDSAPLEESAESIIVDTGTSFTFLPPAVVQELQWALVQSCAPPSTPGYPPSRGGSGAVCGARLVGPDAAALLAALEAEDRIGADPEDEFDAQRSTNVDGEKDWGVSIPADMGLCFVPPQEADGGAQGWLERMAPRMPTLQLLLGEQSDGAVAANSTGAATGGVFSLHPRNYLFRMSAGTTGKPAPPQQQKQKQQAPQRGAVDASHLFRPKAKGQKQKPFPRPSIPADAAAGAVQPSIFCLSVLPNTGADGRNLLGASALLDREAEFDLGRGVFRWRDAAQCTLSAPAPAPSVAAPSTVSGGLFNKAPAAGRRLLSQDSEQGAAVEYGVGARGSVAALVFSGLCVGALLACLVVCLRAALRRRGRSQGAAAAATTEGAFAFARVGENDDEDMSHVGLVAVAVDGAGGAMGGPSGGASRDVSRALGGARAARHERQQRRRERRFHGISLDTDDELEASDSSFGGNGSGGEGGTQQPVRGAGAAAQKLMPGGSKAKGRGAAPRAAETARVKHSEALAEADAALDSWDDEEAPESGAGAVSAAVASKNGRKAFPATAVPSVPGNTAATVSGHHVRWDVDDFDDDDFEE